MLRVDFYAQHLIRHNANEIELSSGQAVLFRLPTGDRRTNTAIDHAQIVQLLQEAAPASVIEEFKQTGRAQFTHDARELTIEVFVEATSASVWTIRIRPQSDAPPSFTTQALPERGTAASAKSAETNTQGTTSSTTEKSVDLKPAAVSAAQWEEAASGLVEAVVKKVAARNSIMPPPVDMQPGEPRINRFLREMIRVGASDLHMSSSVAPMVRLHGEMQVLEQRAPFKSEELKSMLLEIMPERNRREFEENWDSDFAHTIEGLSRFRGNVFMDRNGVGAVFRQIPFKILAAEQLGISEKVLDLCWLTKGLVVVTGPTGSGKSTTLAALIDFINENRADHLITIEDPIEFVHPNKKCLVNQREIATHTKGFKSALRAALREDPDIVLVGEMRDLETIAIAIETAETGHLVFGTLHTTSAASTVDRIIDQFPADRQDQIRVMLSESLRGVIAQVLCKKKGGGRIAAYEILLSNAAVSNLIREGKTFQLGSVMQTGRTQGMQTMNDHLLQHVKNGLVEPEEAYMKANDKHNFKDALKKANIELKLGSV